MPKVIFVDNHLLVLSKPPGLPTQPTPDSLASLETWGKEWLKKAFQKPGAVFLHAVHRIDKPASGLVLFARTSKALSRLQSAIRQDQMQKTYFALIQGELLEETGELTDWLVHEQHHAQIVPAESGEGKKCVLNYRVIKQEKAYTLLEIALKTGRYHQIRAQFSTRGFPIVGDRKYGSSTVLSHPQAIALHHGQLKIPHPISGKILSFSSLVPSFWPVDLPSQFFCERPDSEDSSCLSDLAAGAVSDNDDQYPRY